jgi:hypothetical protein
MMLLVTKKQSLKNAKKCNQIKKDKNVPVTKRRFFKRLQK